MIDFCTLYLSNIPFIAKSFMVVALGIAVLSALVGLYKVYKTEPAPPPTDEVALAQANASALTPFIQALTGLLETLAKGPAWFAMFLAGLFLFWMAGEAHKNICTAQPAGTQRAGAGAGPDARPAPQTAPGSNPLVNGTKGQ